MPRSEKQRNTASSPASATPSSSSRGGSSGSKKSSQRQQQPKRPSCLVCKFRRVKCDGVRPTCGQCKQVKRVCHGYPDDPNRAGSSSSASSARQPTPALTHAESSTAGESPKVQFGHGPEDRELESSTEGLALWTPPRTPVHEAVEPKTLDSSALSRLSTSFSSLDDADFDTGRGKSGIEDGSSSTPTISVTDFDFSSGPLVPFYRKPELHTPEDPLVHMYRNRTMPALHPTGTWGLVGEWRSYLLQATDNDTTLRYVASALASYHENYLSHSPSSGVVAMRYYGKGLASMTNSFPRATLDPSDLLHLMISASVLLGVEYFRRNYPAVRIHLVSIIKVLGEKPGSFMTTSLTLAERFFRRTYLYFAFFPSLYPAFNTLTHDQVPYRSDLPDLPVPFASLIDAEQLLHDILWPCMFFDQTLEQNPHLRLTPAAVAERQSLENAFSTWSTAFEAMLSRTYRLLPAQQQIMSDMYRLWVAMFRLRMMHALVEEQVPFDAHIPTFRAMLTQAKNIDERSVHNTTLSLEPVLGFQTVLFYIITRCRDPRIRRDTVAFIRHAKVTHAQWYPPASAAVGMRIAEVEEGGWRARYMEEMREARASEQQQRQAELGQGSEGPGRRSSTASTGSSTATTITGSVVSKEGRRTAERTVPVRNVSAASDIKEVDRVRNVKLHTDHRRGVVELGYVCWYGEQGGWMERREVLNLKAGGG